MRWPGGVAVAVSVAEVDSWGIGAVSVESMVDGGISGISSVRGLCNGIVDHGFLGIGDGPKKK